MPRQQREKTQLAGAQLARRGVRKEVASTIVKPKSHPLPKGRINKKLGPRAGTRRIQNEVAPLIQAVVNNLVDDMMGRAAIICHQANRRTVRAEHISAAAKTAGKAFLASD
jgi:histone H3/H4